MKNTIFTNFEDRFGLHASVIVQYVWFLVDMYIGAIITSSGQLAELIVYMVPLEQICRIVRSYSVLFLSKAMAIKTQIFASVWR